MSSGLQRYGNDVYVGSLTILQSIMQLTEHADQRIYPGCTADPQLQFWRREAEPGETGIPQDYCRDGRIFFFADGT